MTAPAARPLSLTETVEIRTPADELLEATLPTPSAHREGDAERVRALLAEHRDETNESVWVAAAVGDAEAVRAHLERAPELANARGGTRRWQPLLYLCFSRLLRLGEEPRRRAFRDCARLLLAAGADPNACWIDPQEAEGNRETPLYGAAGIANDVELTRLLIEAGADPNDGETAYHMVEHDGVPCAELVFPLLEELQRGIALGHKVDYEDLAGLRRLLELGGDPNGPTPFAYFPLHMAVWRGRPLDFFELLLEFGADLDLPNKEGRTAYAMAARSGRREIVAWLEQRGAATALAPVDELIAAAAAGDGARARSLLERRPELLERFTDRDRAEICEAAAAGNLAGVQTMLDVGWDVNTRGVVWRETPAHRAALEGHLDILLLLVEHGADLTVTDSTYRCTPLAWAQHGEQQEVVATFLQWADRLDVWDAIELDLTERALALLAEEPLASDVDVALRGTSRGVLLRLASSRGNRELVEALLGRGADPSARTSYGMNAVDVAREAGHEEIETLLRRAHG